VDPGWRTGGAAGARANPQGLNNYLMSAGAGRGAPRTGYLPGSGVLRWWARAEKGAAGARADPQGLNNYLISAGAGRGAPRTGYLPGSGVLRWWARAERGGEAPASPGGRPPGARQLNIFLSSTTIFEATPFIYPATLFHPPTCRSCFRRFGAVFFPNNALMCSFYTDPPIALLKVRVKHRKRDFVVGAIFRSGLRPRGVRTLGRMHPGAAGCEAPRGPASTRQPRSPNPNKQTGNPPGGPPTARENPGESEIHQGLFVSRPALAYPVVGRLSAVKARRGPSPRAQTARRGLL
jgi:hypothetical protein